MSPVSNGEHVQTVARRTAKKHPTPFPCSSHFISRKSEVFLPAVLVTRASARTLIRFCQGFPRWEPSRLSASSLLLSLSLGRLRLQGDRALTFRDRARHAVVSATTGHAGTRAADLIGAPLDWQPTRWRQDTSPL